MELNFFRIIHYEFYQILTINNIMFYLYHINLNTKKSLFEFNKINFVLHFLNVKFHANLFLQLFR